MPPEDLPSQPVFPPLRTGGIKKNRVVGFDTSPSSVLRPAAGDDSPASAGRHAGGLQGPVESPLAALLKRERSCPSMPQLPKLKLGLGKGGKGMQRSKSHGNLRQSQPAEVPAAPKPAARSATSSPHAASSGGSEPVRIPLELTRRRAASVDFGAQGLPEDDLVSTPVISAASSLLGHHLGAGSGTGSPTSGTTAAAPAAASGVMMRSQSAAKDLFLAQADAVMAHAQVQSLQAALRKEQDEVVRLRQQLELMTAERDKLLAELQQGCEAGSTVFDMDSSSSSGGGMPHLRPLPAHPAAPHHQEAAHGHPAAAGPSSGNIVAAAGPPQRRPGSGLRTTLRLP